MTGSNTHRGVANAGRTRLGVDWVPAHDTEAHEYPVTEGPVANPRRAHTEEDPAGGGES